MPNLTHCLQWNRILDTCALFKLNCENLNHHCKDTDDAKEKWKRIWPFLNLYKPSFVVEDLCQLGFMCYIPGPYRQICKPAQ